MEKNKKINIEVECSFLPIGSVVMLKDATTPLVIIGFAIAEKNKEKIWDYMGVIYPMGYMSSDKNLLFNRDQIAEVLSEGYSNDDDKYFRLELERNLLAVKR